MTNCCRLNTYSFFFCILLEGDNEVKLPRNSLIFSGFGLRFAGQCQSNFPSAHSSHYIDSILHIVYPISDKNFQTMLLPCTTMDLETRLDDEGLKRQKLKKEKEKKRKKNCVFCYMIRLIDSFFRNIYSSISLVKCFLCDWNILSISKGSMLSFLYFSCLYVNF